MTSPSLFLASRYFCIDLNVSFWFHDPKEKHLISFRPDWSGTVIGQNRQECFSAPAFFCFIEWILKCLSCLNLKGFRLGI